jgi:hypothetical protein
MYLKMKTFDPSNRIIISPFVTTAFTLLFLSSYTTYSFYPPPEKRNRSTALNSFASALLRIETNNINYLSLLTAGILVLHYPSASLRYLSHSQVRYKHPDDRPNTPTRTRQTRATNTVLVCSSNNFVSATDEIELPANSSSAWVHYSSKMTKIYVYNNTYKHDYVYI